MGLICIVFVCILFFCIAWPSFSFSSCFKTQNAYSIMPQRFSVFVSCFVLKHLSYRPQINLKKTPLHVIFCKLFQEIFLKKILCQGIPNSLVIYELNNLITWLSEICLTSLIALFWNFPLMICNFPLLFSHSKNIRMSTLITIIITY